MKALERSHAKGEAGAPGDSHYCLICPACGGRYEDSRRDFLLSCPEPHPPALLRAEYRQKRLVAHPGQTGVFRFSDWLPIRRRLPGASEPAVYRSAGLGPLLGLENLLIIFSGYWPEKGALMETCTFKELEAQAVCGRIFPDWRSSLVISSAGNTARAFLHACTLYDVPALIVVPGHCLSLLWSTGRVKPFVRLAVLEGDADYADAIALGNKIAGFPGFYPEGGARNAARRDGMGTAVLRAVEEAGAIPDHYFQAVGSGTGAIAAWEMNLRLVGDGRFGEKKMKLHLAQNAPFTPLVDAWEAGSRTLAVIPEIEAKVRLRAMRAQVLSNRNPPYSIAGGLYDALRDTGGVMYRVSNAEAKSAGRLFEKSEGCDLDPAAEVAVASLLQAVHAGRVRPAEVVALNVTGGGRRKLEKVKRTARLRPDISFTLEELRGEGSESILRKLKEAKG